MIAAGEDGELGTVRATVDTRTFTGRILGRGFDGEPVIYLEDARGRTRAVRPERPRHDLDADAGGSST
jgi:hypothetical protein